MHAPYNPHSERVLVLAPQGRNAQIAAGVINEARMDAVVCEDMPSMLKRIENGAGVAIVTEESIRDVDMNPLAQWIGSRHGLTCRLLC